MEVQTYPSWMGQAPLAAAGLLLMSAMVLGGTSGGRADALVHAAAVLVFALAALSLRPEVLDRLQKVMLWTLVAGLALAALQLVPLPAAIFAEMPQRAQILAELRSAGLDPDWLPMTLDRWGTFRALLALFSFLSMWMLCMILSDGARIHLLKLAVATAVPMALLGFAQASLKLDTTGANGLFDNRNHYAALMAMLVPFAFAAARQALDRKAFAWGVAWHGAAVMMLLAAALSFSRVGSALALFSAITAFWLVGGGNARGYASRNGALIALTVSTVAAAYFASDRLLQRFRSDMLGDLRWEYFENSWEVLKAYAPWGSGFGSFRAVYAQFEPLQSLGEFTFANHAHNELLQNTIEGGLPALALMAAFVAVVAVAASRVLRFGLVSDYWRRAALISVSVPLLHSLVDYPLRTFACSTLLAVALAVLVSGGAGRLEQRPGKRPQRPGQLR